MEIRVDFVFKHLIHIREDFLNKKYNTRFTFQSLHLGFGVAQYIYCVDNKVVK